MDEIIALIKESPSPAEAKARLLARSWRSALVEEMLAAPGAELARPEGLPRDLGLTADGYKLSEAQAQRILEMQLQRLTALEQDKILAEYREVMDMVVELLDILSKPQRMTAIIADESSRSRQQFGDKRRSEIQSRRPGPRISRT